MHKITKEIIENIATEIKQFAKQNGLGEDFNILYNNKIEKMDYSDGWNKGKWVVKEDVNPLDYCEYFPENFILGMSYDGVFYEMMNGYRDMGTYNEFRELFKKYDLYFELMDSCHMALYPANDDVEIEYTVFKRKEIIDLYNRNTAPTIFQNIMKKWFELSAGVGDIGSCVLGAYLEFDYDRDTYRMSPQSPYQGSISWETPLPQIKKMLSDIGATNIYYCPGHLD